MILPPLKIEDGNSQYNGLTADLDVSVIDNDAEIGGVVWHDVNGNRKFDSDESGIADWVLYLDENINGELDNNEIQVTTNNNGEYIFTNLTPGTYTIAQQLQPNWQQTCPKLRTKNNLNPPQPLLERGENEENSPIGIFKGIEILSTEETIFTTTGSDVPLFISTLENPVNSYQNFSATDLINLDEFKNNDRFANIDGSGFATVIIDTGIDLNHTAFGEDGDNGGSKLDLSGLTNLVGGSGFAHHNIDAISGGEIDLTGLTSIDGGYFSNCSRRYSG